MDLYEDLKLEPVRFQPDVWVIRIVILERIKPSPLVIRDIPLSPGLNIIWAEESENDDSKTNITGHSAGKTTFCRLFRYVLGERTFGSKAVMSLIRREFPKGYVAAELHVLGRKWAVRRPFGVGQASYVKEDADIEELLELGGRKATQESYIKDIGLEYFLNELETVEIVQTRELIDWLHILAWCTRDQEARFQSIYDWRSPRSESETPSLRFPKAGPLFLMRTALGLFLPDELKAEEKLSELQKEKDRLTKEIEDKRREPQFRVNFYDYQLRRHLQSILPTEPDIDSCPFRSSDLFTEDLVRLSGKARGLLEQSKEEGEQEHQALQIQIDELGARLRMHQDTIEQLDALFKMYGSASRESDAGQLEQKTLDKIQEYKDRLCPFGGILFRECSYVQNRQSTTDISKFRDSRAMEQENAGLLSGRQRVDLQRVTLQNEMARIEEERKIVIEKREALVASIRKQVFSIMDIEHLHDELLAWVHKRDMPGGYQELDSLRGQLNSTEKKMSKLEEELGALIHEHDENRKRLAAIFSKAVRSVLSSEKYDGQVSLKNRELSFSITQGPAMSGEAVDTLSVLLSDIAALIYTTVSPKGHLPGFLLHDSPREADLGIGIYRSFIRFVASLQEHFGEAAGCPFQYLITTTTPPPEELQTEKYVKLQLNASSVEGLLLRRNIAVHTEMPQQMLIF